MKLQFHEILTLKKNEHNLTEHIKSENIKNKQKRLSKMQRELLAKQNKSQADKNNIFCKLLPSTGHLLRLLLVLSN